METGLEVKDSKIAGQGLFAARPFAKGEVVVAWDTSKTFTEDEAQALPEAQQHFLYPLPNGRILLQ